MGFRIYLGTIEKDKHKEITDFTRVELVKYMIGCGIDLDLEEGQKSEDAYLSLPTDLLKNENLYELGSNVDLFGISLEPFFTNQELEEHYNGDYTFKILTKEGFMEILEEYQKRVTKMFETMMYNFDIIGTEQKAIENAKLFFRKKFRTWQQKSYANIIDTNLTTPEITTSWEYEYAIFELTRILKSIDWDNEEVVIYGY